MDTARLQVLQNIIQISKQMLLMARENQWQHVAEMDAQRRLMVQGCFQRAAPEQDASQVAAAIGEILRLNQEVAELGQQWRSQLGAEIHAGKVGRAASAAYLSLTR